MKQKLPKSKKKKLGFNKNKKYEKPLSLYGMSMEKLLSLALREKQIRPETAVL